MLEQVFTAQRDHAQLVMVGDSAQAIYGWRGATDVMTGFDAEQLTLTRSFRFGPQIADEANVRDLEDRRFLILVDRNDRLRILHSGKMLDRARDTDRDIDARSDDLARLPDLIVVGRITRVHRCARRADRGAQLVGKRIQQGMELLVAAEGASAQEKVA